MISRWVLLLLVCLLSACGDFEWLPSNQTTSSSGAPTTSTTDSVLGKYVATNQETASDPSFVYHYPTHGMKIIVVDHRIWFQSAAEAVATGRRPCLTCTPPTTD